MSQTNRTPVKNADLINAVVALPIEEQAALILNLADRLKVAEIDRTVCRLVGEIAIPAAELCFELGGSP